MTDPSVETFFAEEWPAIAADLARWLPYRGVARQDVPDLVQETAVRLLRRWADVDVSQDVTPLARVIALNVWRDRMKAASSREVSTETLPDDAVDHVEREVVARADMATVVASLAALPAAQQDAIRAAVAAAWQGTGGEPRGAAFRMALMRARRALAAKITGIAWLWPRRRGVGPEVIGTTAAVVVALILNGPFAPGTRDDRRPPPRATAPASPALPDADVLRGGTVRVAVAAPAAGGAQAVRRPATNRPAPQPQPTAPSLLPVNPPGKTPGDPRFVIPRFAMTPDLQRRVDRTVCREGLSELLCET